MLNKKLIQLMASIVIATAACNAGAATLTTQVGFDAFSRDIGRATTYRAAAPADPLGLTGFDLAIEATSTKVDGTDVVFPKVRFQKGLILGLDIAGYYSSLPTSQITGISNDATAYGAALSYAFLNDDGDDFMSLALRGSYTSLDVPGAIKTTTTGVDLTASKKLVLLSPYVGVGMVNINSTGSSFSATSQATRSFVGANLNLKIMDIAYELDTTDGVQSQTLKLGFRF
jgi:hypothetical protein